MNILIIIGSGKLGGNTQQLAEAFASGARSSGHTVATAHLGELRVNPCTGCLACKASGDCCQHDDMARIRQLLDQCDTVVLCSPLYFWGISAQLKAVIDRLFAMGEKDPRGYFSYPAKNSVLLMTAADSDRHFWTFESAVQYYLRLTAYMKWRDLGILTAGGCGGSSEPRRIQETPHLREAYDMGRQLPRRC